MKGGRDGISVAMPPQLECLLPVAGCTRIVYQECARRRGRAIFQEAARANVLSLPDSMSVLRAFSGNFRPLRPQNPSGLLVRGGRFWAGDPNTMHTPKKILKRLLRKVANHHQKPGRRFRARLSSKSPRPRLLGLRCGYRPLISAAEICLR